MPTTINFTSLKTDVTRYLQRGGSATTDPIVFDQIPRLINGAERKLAQVLKLLGQIEVLNSNLQAGNPIVAKPDRWRKTISLMYGSGTDQNTRTPLFERSLEFMTSYWVDPTVTDADNPPLYYGDIDYQHWYIAPTPVVNAPLRVVLYCQPPLLDDSNETNFWTDYCGNGLLYGSLLEATPFLKDDGRLNTWGALWQQEIQTLSGQDLSRILDRAAEREAP